MDAMLGFFVFVFAVALYFLPAILAKEKKNASAIIVLNLLLGWTVIGWVAALIWAMTAEEPAPSVPRWATEFPEITEKKCPDCAEIIKADARKCRFCGRAFEIGAGAD